MKLLVALAMLCSVACVVSRNRCDRGDACAEVRRWDQCRQNRASILRQTLDDASGPDHEGILASRLHLTPGTACASAPSVGVLLRKQNGRVHCTATLITPNVVLTAAHCTDNLVPADDLTFALGRDVNHLTDSAHIAMSVVHRDHALGCAGSGDLALLALDTSIYSVRPATWRDEPLHVETLTPMTLLFVGYGYSENGDAKGLGAKKCATLTINETTPVAIRYGQGAYDLCQGDSGGPAFQRRGGGDVLAAITSWGDGPCTDFGISVNVGYYAEWISDTLRQMPAPLPPPAPPGTQRVDATSEQLATLCEVEGREPNGRRCAIYVYSLQSRDDAEIKAEYLRSRGVPAVHVMTDGAVPYVVTVCGDPEVDCRLGQAIRDKVRQFVKRDAVLEPHHDNWHLVQ